MTTETPTAPAPEQTPENVVSGKFPDVTNCGFPAADPQGGIRPCGRVVLTAMPGGAQALCNEHFVLVKQFEFMVTNKGCVSFIGMIVEAKLTQLQQHQANQSKLIVPTVQIPPNTVPGK